jgi:hypothetical protein
MTQELTYWLDSLFNQLFGLSSTYCQPESIQADDTAAPQPRRRTVGCQLCKKRLWTDYTGLVSTPIHTSQPLPPAPKPGEWSHAYYDRYGKKVYSDVCTSCLRQLKAREQDRIRAKKRTLKTLRKL